MMATRPTFEISSGSLRIILGERDVEHTPFHFLFTYLGKDDDVLQDVQAVVEPDISAFCDRNKLDEHG